MKRMFFQQSLNDEMKSAIRICTDASKKFSHEMKKRTHTLVRKSGMFFQEIGKFIWQNRCAVRYYAVLALVLTALGVASYSYRRGGFAADVVKSDPAVAVQSLPQVSAAPTEPPAALMAPVSGSIVGQFQADELIWSETLMQWQTHPATDYAASAGETVVAAADGTVCEAYWDPLYGNTIAIELDDGRMLHYSSLNTLKLVESGQRVKAGTIISAAGTCAAEEHLGAHVHVECFENTVAVDFAALTE